jgi:hypothetical protein
MFAEHQDRTAFRLFLCASVCWIMWVAAAPHSAFSQVLYGSLVGVVTDPSQAPVPNATVVITQVETNQTRQLSTSDSGQFAFPTIPGGTYQIRVSAEGFRPLTQTGVTVSTNTVTRADLRLELGTLTESVIVSAQTAALQTDRAEVRHEVTTRALQNLPVPPGRNYQQLFNTLPGFTSPRNAHSVPSNPSRSLQFEVNGTVAASNNIRLDGATQFNVWLPHITAYVPALEAIETVNVVTNSFDAEQGLAGGAAINVQIKSGTNETHGSAFWYHNNNNTKARPFFLPANQDKPKLVYNQMGATIGGKIVKDKVFYFVSYEGTYDRQFAGTLSSAPTAAMRLGDMSASSRAVYDPATGTSDGKGRDPFPGNKIPAARHDKIALKIVGLMPALTYPDQINANYYSQGEYAFDRKTLDTKLNWNATSKLTSYVRLSLLDYGLLSPTRWGNALIGGSVGPGGNPGQGYGNTYSATMAATYVATPTVILDANFGYTLMDTNVEQPRLDEKIGLEFLGIPGTNGTRRLDGGWPGFAISGFDTFGLADGYMPYFRRDPQYQWVGNANWTRGAHNVRFGAEFSKQNLNHVQPEFYGGSWGAPGGFDFGGGVTTRNGGPASNQFNAMSQFLLGLPNRSGKIYQWPDEYSTRTSMQSLYLRDQWQASRRLTLNLGVRWNYFPMPTRNDRGLERYIFPGNADPSLDNKVMVCGVGNQPNDCGVSMSKSLFAPTIGIAWRATDTLVVRTGYGINIDPWNLARPMRANHPLLTAQTVNSANSFLPVGTLAQGIPVITQPELGNGIIEMPRTVVANTLDSELKRGYIQSWNLTLQKQLGRGWVAQAGYVGTRTIGLMAFEERNYGLPGGGAASRVYFASTGRNVQTRVVNRVGNATYDAAQTTLERRFSAGYQVNFAYTFSKCIGIAGIGNSGDDPSIKIPAYYFLNRSQCGFHQPHRFTAAGLMELPFGAGKPWANSGVARAVLGGWQINGLLSMFAGNPFTVSSSGTSLNAPDNAQRADQVKSTVTKLGGVGRGQAFYDWTAYAPVIDARFGTSGFNTLLGPGMVNLDVGLFRRFRVTERVSVQFRAEAFNLSNTPHFSNPGGNISGLQLNSDGTFRAGVFEVTGVRNTGREGIDEKVFRFGLRIGF